MKVAVLSLIIHLVLVTVQALAAEDVVKLALADGYPPYQFKNDAGEPVGIDVDIVKLLGERLGIAIEIVQGPWDSMVTALRLGEVECIGGMEINEKRQRIFDFTTPYYSRKGVVFTLSENTMVQNLHDLQKKIIAGDRQSYVDYLLADLGLKNKIRIRHTKSKDQSMQLLQRGEVVAVVAPKAVGFYLAKKYGLSVRIINDSDPGTPVGLAVSKGESELLQRLESALSGLREQGRIAEVLKKWQIH